MGRVGVGVVFGWDACQCLVSSDAMSSNPDILLLFGGLEKLRVE